LRQACPWWEGHTAAGVWVMLRRLGIHWRRGREHIHSPDPHYRAKMEWVQLLRELAQRQPGQHVLLWLDEMTYYRQPTLGYAWAGAEQPRAERSYRSNTAWRIVAALNPENGVVHYHQGSHITVPTLMEFYTGLCHYYAGKQLWVAQDNWPVHFHPGLLAYLQPQEAPFPPHLSRTWAQIPKPKPHPDPLPVQLVPLPTYAPWCNPIEKLWRWLRQDVLHLHPWADDQEELHRQIDLFLAQFAHGSSELLRYVGLLVPN